MKATDFTLAWMQKFDFDGKPYKSSKIDINGGTNITYATFADYTNYTPEERNNVMVVLSDALCYEKTSNSGFVFQEGEIVYLSTLLNRISVTGFVYKFGYLREQLQATFNQSSGTKIFSFQPLAGTFYIFDFNDNPV